MKYNIERMKKEKIAVNCKTKKEFNEILTQSNFEFDDTDWNLYEEGTCVFFEGGMCFFGDKGYCKDNEYKVISAKSLIVKEPFNIQFRRTIINEMLRNGKIATINFIKKDGTERKMNCRIKRVDKPKKESYKSNVETMTVFDLVKKEYRSFRLDSVVSISGRSETITFG